MSKKKNKNKETTIENYYDLRTKEVDELVAALKGDVNEAELEPVSTNIAEITGEEEKAKKGTRNAEFDPYKRDKLSKIPVWLKACFIKFWFAGAVCYFVNMGLGVYINAAEDLLVIDGVLLGILVDCLVNPIFRMMESDRKEYNNYMMFPFPFKKFWTFFTNIIYYIIVFIVVNYSYMGINLLIELIKPTWYIAIEPLLFGLLVLIADMAFIGIKDLIVYLVKRKKRKKEEEQDV